MTAPAQPHIARRGTHWVSERLTDRETGTTLSTEARQTDHRGGQQAEWETRVSRARAPAFLILLAILPASQAWFAEPRWLLGLSSRAHSLQGKPGTLPGQMGLLGWAQAPLCCGLRLPVLPHQEFVHSAPWAGQFWHGDKRRSDAGHGPPALGSPGVGSVARTEVSSQQH